MEKVTRRIVVMDAKARNRGLVKEIRTLFEFGAAAHCPDRHLLDRFLNGVQPDAEAAFALLVERHGPMVWYVCRQVLGDLHDGQDAFQATFLVLLRRAESIRKRDSLASWLFGVALKVARRARYAAIARRFHERSAGELAPNLIEATDEHSECRAALHEEIARLPARYREPIVLYHLEGLSTVAAAERLGCAQGTILSRLARGRERLRRRIHLRGLAFSPGLLMPPCTWPGVALDLPHTLVKLTINNAVSGNAGRWAADAIAARATNALTQAMLRGLLTTRTTLITAVLIAVTGMIVSARPVTRQFVPAGAEPIEAANETTGERQKSVPSERERQFPADDLEDAFYRILKRDHEFNDPEWPFTIKVRDVQAKTLIDATIKRRAIKGNGNEYDAIILAERAEIRFDLKAMVIRAVLEKAEMQRLTRDAPIDSLSAGAGMEMSFPFPNRFMPNQAITPSVIVFGEVRLTQIEDQFLSLAYAPDSKLICTSGSDGSIALWKPAENKRIGEFKAGTSAVRTVKFAPSGLTLLSLADDGVARLWDVSTGKLNKNIAIFSESARCTTRAIGVGAAAFTTDGERLALSAWGKGINADGQEPVFELRVMGARAGDLKWSHMGRGEAASSLAFSHDGRTLASAGWKGARLWNAQTGEFLRTFSPRRGGINAVAFTPDGRALVGGGTDGSNGPDSSQHKGVVTIWNAESGELLHAMDRLKGVVREVAIAPDGRTVASGSSAPGEVRLWEFATGKPIWATDAGTPDVRSLTFSPDGKKLTYCDRDGVHELDVHTGKLTHTITTTALVPVREGRRSTRSNRGSQGGI
jgi:RNA polymerase sigma factor (sigma-70 family)